MEFRSTITDETLHSLLELHASTTTGRWISLVEGRDHSSGSNFIKTGGEDIELSGASIADQDFIAEAHEVLPKLISELLHLRHSGQE